MRLLCSKLIKVTNSIVIWTECVLVPLSRTMPNSECYKSQCHWRMFGLRHTSPSDFYVSCWQSGRSAVPLLSLRCFLFLYSLSTLVTSMVLTPMTMDISVGFWFIYLTHWAFLLIVLATGSSVAVSACVYFNEPIGTQLTYLILNHNRRSLSKLALNETIVFLTMHKWLWLISDEDD